MKIVGKELLTGVGGTVEKKPATLKRNQPIRLDSNFGIKVLYDNILVMLIDDSDTRPPHIYDATLASGNLVHTGKKVIGNVIHNIKVGEINLHPKLLQYKVDAMADTGL